MAVITPVGNVGKDFDWSPKEKELVKTASTDKTVQAKSDKDILYEAAKKFVKAQMMDELPGDVKPPCEPPCEGMDGVEGAGKDVVVDLNVAPEGEVEGALPPEVAPADAAAIAPEGGVGDVQKAVKELVDKANKAEEIAGKVEQAVGKVEEAVQEVKDVIGVAVENEIPEEVEIEIEDEKGEEKGEKEEAPEKEEDIVQESKEGKADKKEDKEACSASSKNPSMKSAASEDDLTKLAALSPSVKQKIYDYWKNDLKYAPDYCKLLVTDS